nr:proline-serine-threonine phosphatase-interacting protein 2 isoform X2 [Taeniopygia guttata]
MGLSHGALIPSLPSPPAPPACCSTSRSSTRGHPGAGAPVRGRRLRGPGRAGPGAAECGGGGSRMREARFRDNFWSTDLTSTVGYDSIIQHLNDGRKNCKEFEDFLKERAIIEEKYGKELINLSKKKPCGQTELNTLKRSLDVFKQQIDNVGQGHIQLAQTLREEAKKMEDFREKQKLHRKKIELIMEAIHKNRNLQYKKTMEFFETQECERINYFRNALWLHVNQLSLGCVQNDEKYEEIRKSLEMCSIEKDVDFFVNLRKTGSLAPAPVVYENYYNAQRNVTPVRSPAPVPIPRRGPLPTPTSAPGEPDYATVDGYSLVFQKAEDTVGLTSVVEMAFSVIPRHTEMKCFCFSREYLRTTIIICTFRKCLLKIYAGDQQTPWMDLHIPGRKGPDAGIICVRKRF